jgi:fatty acid synthase subunit alpha
LGNRIATQDDLLKEQNIERFIEIGPADILSGMLRKTVGRQYKSQDAARHMTRKLLSYAQNAQEIQYTLASSSTVSSKTAVKSAIPPSSQEPSPPKAAVETTPPSAPAVSTAVTHVAKVAMIADAPVQAKDIVIAVIAQKLRKNHTEVAMDKTIKALVSGISSTHTGVPIATAN